MGLPVGGQGEEGQEEERRQEEERLRQAEEERREQERREEEERIAREIQAAMDDAEEREAIIERCDNQAREQYRWTKLSREETEQRTQEAFQECLSDAGLEGAEEERATSEQEEVERAIHQAAQARAGDAYQTCMRRATGDRDLNQEAIAEASAVCQTRARDNFVQAGGGDDRAARARDEGATRGAAEAFQTCMQEGARDRDLNQEAIAELTANCEIYLRENLAHAGLAQAAGTSQASQEERQREQDQDVAPLAEQAEELAEEEAPVDGTAEERIAALEERVAELTELIRDLTEALQSN